MTLASREDAAPAIGAGALGPSRERLLGELAGGPSRRGYAIAYDLLGNRAEAEEAVQEALARACESIGDLREDAAAPAWFLRIVTTMCLRVLRRRRLKRALFGAPRRDETTVEDELPQIAERMHAVDALPGPDELALARRTQRALLDHLDALPAQQRVAVVLRYGHELGVPEIAAMLGVSQATAKTHLVRGLARLRQRMEERS